MRFGLVPVYGTGILPAKVACYGKREVEVPILDHISLMSRPL